MVEWVWYTMRGNYNRNLTIDRNLLTVIYRALILHYISHASIQVSHVQCLILMASFLCSVNCLPQAWLLVGQAVRSAQDLGLHVRNYSLLQFIYLPSKVTYCSDLPVDCI